MIHTSLPTTIHRHTPHQNFILATFSPNTLCFSFIPLIHIYHFFSTSVSNECLHNWAISFMKENSLFFDDHCIWSPVPENLCDHVRYWGNSWCWVTLSLIPYQSPNCYVTFGNIFNLFSKSQSFHLLDRFHNNLVTGSIGSRYMIIHTKCFVDHYNFYYKISSFRSSTISVEQRAFPLVY